MVERVQGQQKQQNYKLEGKHILLSFFFVAKKGRPLVDI